jgi:hypothetical protein
VELCSALSFPFFLFLFFFLPLSFRETSKVDKSRKETFMDRMKVNRCREMMLAPAKKPSVEVAKNTSFIPYPDSLTWARAMKGALTHDQVMAIYRRNPDRTHTEQEVSEAYRSS